MHREEKPKVAVDSTETNVIRAVVEVIVVFGSNGYDDE